MSYDLEPRQFIYNRTGNLSTVTEVNKPITTEFMRVADLRRNITIVDSDKKPDANVVSVNSETLAWRAIAPLSELTKIVLKPKPFHQVEIVNDQYKVSIHHLLINDAVRDKGYKDREDYEKKFLGMLNREVKDATTEALFAEKLGFRDQKINYFVCVFQSFFLLPPLLSFNTTLDNYIKTAIFDLFFLAWQNSFFNNLNNDRFLRFHLFEKLMDAHEFGSRPMVPPSLNYRPLHQIFYPMIPVDKYIKGRRFLAIQFWVQGSKHLPILIINTGRLRII